ncbi:MAG: hypothetical protein WCH34_16645 [Bacteroidota bacterium]
MEKKTNLCEKIETEKNTYSINESSDFKHILASVLNKLSNLFFISLNLKFGAWDFNL